jgi:hypothetical protein
MFVKVFPYTFDQLVENKADTNPTRTLCFHAPNTKNKFSPMHMCVILSVKNVTDFITSSVHIGCVHAKLVAPFAP